MSTRKNPIPRCASACASVRANKNVAKTYGANKGEHFVRFTSKEAMSFDGTYGDTKLKIGSNDTVLAIETYYTFPLYSWKVTLDYQFINNPAYNRERGPVSVLGTRLHMQF